MNDAPGAATRGPGRPSKGPRSRVTLRLPTPLAAALAAAARSSGRTLNDEILHRIGTPSPDPDPRHGEQ